MTEITLVGIILTFVVGIINLLISIQNSKKTIFINSITASRIKYINDLRNTISKFCGLVSSYNLKVNKLNEDELFQLQKEADTIKFQLKLYLNPEDNYWDNEIMNCIDAILQNTDKNPLPKIDQLIILTQYLLKLEWEGVKLESEKGILSELTKKELYKKYMNLHKIKVKQNTQFSE
ncbi:MAG TPA: hypothetical protein VFI29_02595 [Hanamia sp.]|nr:hypothetical protein [Hanamia sp.]